MRRAGATAVRLSRQEELDLAIEADGVGDRPLVRGAVVDLNGHRYDGIEAIGSIVAARLPVIAVAQHDDQVTRKRALAAGALRVFSYQKFFTDGARLVADWLVASSAAPE